jgi:hypothetical protein
MRWLILLLLAMSSLIGSPAGAQLPEPQIWFVATAATQVDSPDMWTKNAPWQEAARKVKVLVIVHERVSQASVPELIQIRDFAKAHHMQIDLSTEAVAKTAICGGEEGYTWPGENGGAAKILFDLGIKVDWVDMDSPMNSGHYDTGPQSCQLPIPDLIPRVAITLQDVFALYPDARLVDIEPLPGLEQQPNWRQDVQNFHEGLAQQLGVRVTAIQTDVNWRDRAWPQAMLDLRDYLHEKNQQLAVIYDPIAGPPTDADATSTMVDNFEAVEGRYHIIPDMAVFESWDPHPAYAMPETSPTAETWVINRYPRPRSELQVQFVGQGAQGKLTTVDGKPIANATVNGYQPGVDFTQPLPVTVDQGTVPPNAATALLVLRFNTECGCDGTNHVLVGTLQYQEISGGTGSFGFSWPTYFQQYGGTIVDGQLVGGTMVTEVVALPGQAFAPNSNNFAVTPGAQFQFSIPAATVGGNGWFGYAAIIWIDANGNAISREEVTPPPGKALMATAVTQPDGTFTFNSMPRSVDGPAPVTVEFDGGGGAYRSTVWTPRP